MDDRETELLAELTEMEGFPILRKRTAELRGQFLEQLAQKLYNDPRSVDAAYLLEMRAYFKGMARILNEPLFAMKTLERDLARRDSSD